MVDFKLDYFKAYTVVREKYKEIVEIKDQFHENWIPIVLDTKAYFLTPVKKNDEKIINETAYLTWYSLNPPISIKEITITYLNQITDNHNQHLIIDNLIGLLVPTRNHQDHSDFSYELDHYTVYSVKDRIDVTKYIKSEDQFVTSKASKLQLYAFCVPCLKRRIFGKEKSSSYQYHNHNDHLTIYKLATYKNALNKSIDTSNQFGENSFIVLKQKYLLVPTHKVDWSLKEE